MEHYQIITNFWERHTRLFTSRLGGGKGKRRRPSHNEMDVNRKEENVCGVNPRVFPTRGLRLKEKWCDYGVQGLLWPS